MDFPSHSIVFASRDYSTEVALPAGADADRGKQNLEAPPLQMLNTTEPREQFKSILSSAASYTSNVSEDHSLSLIKMRHASTEESSSHSIR